MQESVLTLRCTHAYRWTDTAHIEHICVGLAYAGPNSKSLLISNNYYYLHSLLNIRDVYEIEADGKLG